MLYKPFASPVGELYEDYTITEPLDTLVIIMLLISLTEPICINMFCIYPQCFISSLFFSAEVDCSLQVFIRGLRTNLTPTKELLVQVPPRRLSPALQLMQF